SGRPPSAASFVSCQIEIEILCGKDHSVLRQTPEVTMAAHQTAHQAVLQLLRPPDLRELITFAGKQLLAQCGHRKHVKLRSVGIERQCLDVFELPGRLRDGRSCCQRHCACKCYRDAGEFYEPSTIV